MKLITKKAKRILANRFAQEFSNCIHQRKECKPLRRITQGQKREIVELIHDTWVNSGSIYSALLHWCRENDFRYSPEIESLWLGELSIL